MMEAEPYDEATMERHNDQKLLQQPHLINSSSEEDGGVELFLVDNVAPTHTDDLRDDEIDGGDYKINTTDDVRDEDGDGDGNNNNNFDTPCVDISEIDSSRRSVESVEVDNDMTAVEESTEASGSDMEQQQQQRQQRILVFVQDHWNALRHTLDVKLPKFDVKDISMSAWFLIAMTIILLVPIHVLVTIVVGVVSLHDYYHHKMEQLDQQWTHQAYAMVQHCQQVIIETKSLDEFRRRYVLWWASEAHDVEEQLERARKMYNFFLEEQQATHNVAVLKATEELQERINTLELKMQEQEAQFKDNEQKQQEELERLQLEHTQEQQRWEEEMDVLRTKLNDEDEDGEGTLKTRSSFEVRLESSESHSRALQALLLVQEWEQKNERESMKVRNKELEEKVLSHHVQAAKMTRYVAELIQMIQVSGMDQSNGSAIDYSILREAETFLQSVQSKTKLGLASPKNNGRSDSSSSKTNGTKDKIMPRDLSPCLEGEEDNNTENAEDKAVTRKDPPIDTVSGNFLLDFSLLLTTSVDAVYFWTIPLVSSIMPSSWTFTTRNQQK